MALLALSPEMIHDHILRVLSRFQMASTIYEIQIITYATLRHGKIYYNYTHLLYAHKLQSYIYRTRI